MKRIKLSDDELAIIEGLRHEKAIWNNALEAAEVALIERLENITESGFSTVRDQVHEVLVKLRRS